MRPFRIVGDYLEVDLPDGTKTLISRADQRLLEEFPWWRRGDRYVKIAKPTYTADGKRARGPSGNYLMDDDFLHRRILGLAKGELADHINGDGLDNRRENLRRCDYHQNALNKLKKRSKHGLDFKGVFYRPDINEKRPWQAFLTVERKQYHIGYFSTEMDAAVAYNACAKLVHEGFAKLNAV